MLRFGLGLFAGVILAFFFVRHDIQVPGLFQLPGKLQGAVVSSAVEEDLYRLGGDPGVRRRALEVYFANRPGDAAAIDAEAGHPFLRALMAQRAQREARALLSMREGFSAALAKPALRAILERDHGLTEDAALERAMLLEALKERPFLQEWLSGRAENGIDAESLPALLQDVAAEP